MRLSTYTISVKLDVSSKDQYMLIHGYTGAIDIVSGSVIDSLQSFDREDPENCNLSEATVQSLIRRGYLTEKSAEEEYEYVSKVAQLYHRKEKILHTDFVFVVAYDCNFRCPYCFESCGAKGGSRHWSGAVFSEEMVENAFNAMSLISPDDRLRSNTVILYGGEPLLSGNKPIVEYMLAFGHRQGYSFKAITNGYDLCDYEDLLGPGGIEQLQITVDGDKGEHNRRRIHFNDRNSFDRIVKNIGIALKKDANVVVRVNTDANNFADLSSLVALFKELGYYDYEKFSVASSLLIDYKNEVNIQETCSNETRGHMSFMDRKEFNRKHNIESLPVRCQDSGVYDLFKNALDQKKALALTSIFCSSQSGAYIFDPYGDIYPCLTTVGNPTYRIGQYQTDKIIWNEQRQRWHRRNVGNIDRCKACKYAFLCKGGCFYHNLEVNNSDESCYCDHFHDTMAYAVNKAYRDYQAKLQNPTVAK